MKAKVLIIIFQAFLFYNSYCQYCNVQPNSIANLNCFNNIKMFDLENKYYRAGHSSINKNGDIVIEYSHLQYRLFYGLKKNGQYFFPNETKEIKIESEGIFDNETIRRYESINSFVSLKNDTNKEKEYLISISSWKTILELHDLENDEYRIKRTVDFTHTEKGIFSFVFQLLEVQIDNQIIYFCVYIYSEYDSSRDVDIGSTFVIKKFALNNFDLDSIQLINEIFFVNGRNRIISSIIMNKYKLLLVFFVRIDSDNNYNYLLYYYDYNLINLGQRDIYNDFNNYYAGYGNFFKTYVLEEDYIVFIYFLAQYKYRFQIWKIAQYDNYYNFNAGLKFVDEQYPLDCSITLNDFIKIDDNRLALISTSQSVELFVILFDLYDNYTRMRVRYYYFYIYNEKISKFVNELSGFIYNGYLGFTATVFPSNAEDSSDTFPILMIFGYGNGTDLEIDISPYFIDSDRYSNSINLINDLIEHLQIDNNIFSYEKEDKIKLTLIPPEILFYYEANNSLLINEDIIDNNYILKQNNAIVKENLYYFLEFQFILKESDYTTFYGNAFLTKDVNASSDLNNYFQPKTFYGRNNILKFKLCYDYCETCRKFDSNEFGQKCESCLPNYKFYIDETDNCKICFNENSTCPEGYYYNNLTKECSNTPTNEENTIKNTIEQTLRNIL